MKNRILPFIALFFVLLFILKGCRKDEITEDSSTVFPVYPQTRTIGYPPGGNFFQPDGVDENLHKIITSLQQINDSTEYTTTFIANYGYPLWQYAIQFPNDNKIVYAVPVINETDISTIWFFEMNHACTHYYILPRPGEENPLYVLNWMFDYFNIELSCYTPEVEGEVIRFVSPQTRSYTIERCNDIYTGYVNSEGIEILEYSETHCWTEYYIIWGDFNGGSGIPGDGFVDPVPGGGGGSGTIPASSGKNKELFHSTDNLDETGNELLEEAVSEIKDNCYAQAIYDYLVSNGKKFSDVIIDPDMDGNGSMMLTTEKLKFQSNDKIGFTTLYHEMFHLFQKGEGSYTGNEVIGMMEYERTLFEDIAFTVQHMKKKEIPLESYYLRKSSWVYAGKTRSEQTRYEDWLKKITKKGKSYPSSISNEDFKKWAVYFGKGNLPYGNYKYDIEYSPDALNKALELAKKNCKNKK